MLKRLLWHYVNAIVFKITLFPLSNFKVFLLRLFGAKIGYKVFIKSCVNIKYPWNLIVGGHTWIDENVWIDNLVMVTIGSNVCVSQGATLITGSHNFKKTTFDLIIGKIVLENGKWMGALTVANQGIIFGSHSILTAGSVASKDIEPYGIYQGSPAINKRDREIS